MAYCVGVVADRFAARLESLGQVLNSSVILMNSHPWTQLEGVEQILPNEGWDYEQLRRKLLDRLYLNGYELVVPPLADFAESLLSGASEDLDVMTVKAPDHVSGRLYGIRADMTPQVARIAACHMPVSDQVVRLCYLGPTLLARAANLGGSRELMQFGAELFGSSAPESDCEVMRLMVEALQIAGVDPLSVSIGHAGIIREVFQLFELDPRLQNQLLDALSRKSKPDIKEYCARHQIGSDAADVMLVLTDLNGSVDMQAQADSRLGGMADGIDAAIHELNVVVELVRERVSGIHLHLDYAQVGGYRYHTGTTFSAYGPGFGQALAKGGRYDGVLSAYGVPCPATGFSSDLRLLRHRWRSNKSKPLAIPADADVPSDVIESLFERGQRVVYELPGQDPSSIGAVADHKLSKRGDSWEITQINQEI